ncbi:MAG: hypothetical protein ABH882_07485 [Candidatus Omnitrophota bacterium]|nr:hypothetical protein [Candidatus Omnitrophota bacterium]MBU1928948.1 hypothetical protein [Candidatus Omnitrophota bacterium]MBU2034972.1 hypothetical protein [Candidatus Omnitrophota bacterium]MBU2221291.1 hypothetical protein [Candidatus Omnitrophota bacterium]MBU2257925.1 hypothetical protein [Candidatus Omnitrophota bacterium]
MAEIIYFERLIPPLSNSRVYKRLGYRDKITKIGPKQKKEVNGYIKEALRFIRIKAAVRFLAVKKIVPPRVLLYENASFISNNLADLLEGCCEVLLMGATAGNKIIEAIQKDSSGENIMRAVVFDAVASEITDSCLDWLMSYFNKKICRKNKTLTRRRFSAGYGDFLLKNQKEIFKLLELKKIGVEINKCYILNPEKSVTAVAGVKSK